MEGNPKQLIVERIKSATNILVTVGRNPSVDALAAALGFTLMLNKMDKHATAVFSGTIPPAINFLEPAKTFESTVDSLRDFIIALDKEKADRLRYKVEDDVVRIFITPYRTTITEADLNFSQGDFNVELIVALGVDTKDDLDTAITAHGRILHDATVVTINANNDANTLGSIDWSDASASSLCEMLMSLSEALQSGLLDEQIASSLLTGIVAATERFSNPHTSPKVMTMAAQLMAAGANQQLIAAKLEEGHALAPSKPVAQDGSKQLEEGSSEKLAPTPETLAEEPSKDGEMHVSHDESASHSEQQPETPSAVDIANELTAEAVEDKAEKHAQDELSAHTAPATATLSVSDLQKDLEAATQEVESAAGSPLDTPLTQQSPSEPTISPAKVSDWRGKIIEPPSLGGTLSATSSEAEAAKLEEERSSRNHTILSHDGSHDGSQPVNAPASSDEPPAVDIFDKPLSYEETPQPSSKPRVINPLSLPPQDESASIFASPQPQETTAPETPSEQHTPTIAELEAQAHQAVNDIHASGPATIDDARAAVDAALGATFASMPPAPSPETPLAPPQEQTSETILPPPPPMPDFSTLPPLPPLPGEPQVPEQSPPTQSPQFPQPPLSSPNDPGQFKIPGQP